MKVILYCNIRTRTVSIRALEGKCKGLVVASAERVLLNDSKGPVEFKVSAAGRNRVRTSGRKNVHAGISGELVAAWGTVLHDTNKEIDNDTRLALANGVFGPWPGGKRVVYDPRKHDGFVIKGGRRLLGSASRVLLDRCKVEAHQPVYAR